MDRQSNWARHRRVGPPPAWIQVGVKVDYHSIIGGPVTQAGLVVRESPQLIGDHWCAWLEGKAGCVACDALTPHAVSEGDDLCVPVGAVVRNVASGQRARVTSKVGNVYGLRWLRRDGELDRRMRGFSDLLPRSHWDLVEPGDP